MQRAAARHRQLELDAEVYASARGIAERALGGGASLSRDELFAAWEAAGIRTTGQRGYHLIWWLAHDAVVCCGPVEGRGQRFVLLDEWAPATGGTPSRDETLADAARRPMLDGHGPSTVRDFAWWTGLTLGDARTAHAAAGDAVVAFDDERLSSQRSRWTATLAVARLGRLALAAFDEYFLGYADRSRRLRSAGTRQRVVPGMNGVFQPILVANGQVEGVWKAKQAPGGASVVARRLRSRPSTSTSTRPRSRGGPDSTACRLDATAVVES